MGSPEDFVQPDRRAIVKAAVASSFLTASSGLRAAPSLSEANVSPQPSASPPGEVNTSDIVVDTLIAWGATHVFGIVGDGINPMIEALRKRLDKITYVGVRHEEAAAFMASGFAKHTGRLGVCLGTTGPGAVHLLNGLYDAHFDGAPVVAITGSTFHDLGGTRFQQSVNTTALMQDVALYNIEVTGPAHAVIVANRACRAALGDRGVAHLTIAKDVQLERLSADHASMENHGARTSNSWLPVTSAPSQDQLRQAADLLNSGRKVAILAGQGALGARAEVEQVAGMLAAPVAKAMLGKAVLPDDSAYTTGGIGHLGTLPSHWIMKECDTLLILGSTMPWIDYYPKAGQARAVQIDLKPDRIGLRYPAEVGLVGDIASTLRGLIPLLKGKVDKSFLQAAQGKMTEWKSLTDAVEATRSKPLRPQMVVRALSDRLATNAIISLDCGANTHFAARHLRLKREQGFTGTGMLASMGPGVAYAIAAKLAFPERPSVAVVGDGGFAMLMAELSTAVRLNLPVTIVLLKNNSLSEVKFEQKELGYPDFGCELAPIDFVQFAKACGAEGYRCEEPTEVGPALDAALAAGRPALVEAVVDADEPPAKPEHLQA